MNVDSSSDWSGVFVITLFAYLNDFFFHRIGLYITNSNRNFRHVLRNFLKREEIGVVLDVGASYGQYAMALRRGGYRGKIYSFEPQVAEYNRMRKWAEVDGLWKVFNIGLGETNFIGELGVAGNSVSSSLLPMTELHETVAPGSAYIGKVDVEIQTFDKVLTRIKLLPDDLIHLKIDVQGYEHLVLNGAQKLLSNPNLISIEVELSTDLLYEGQSDWLEFVTKLRILGFELYSISSCLFSDFDQRVLQFDSLFKRKVQNS